MNREAAQAVSAETETNRHCSFSGTPEDGVVLHSAKHRNTVFLTGGRAARRFTVAWWSVNSQEARDRLVEGYF